MSDGREELIALLGADLGCGLAPTPGRSAVELAAANGVAAIAWSVLARGGGIDRMDADVREGLRTARDREVALHLRVQSASQRLMRALLEAGIPTLALKGLATRPVLYAPRNMVRAPGDLDILVPSERLEETRPLLRELGYVASTRRAPGYYRRHHHLRPHHLPREPAVLVDVHWTLVSQPNPFRIDLEGCWERALPLEGGPEGARRLDDVDAVLHLALQLDHDDHYGGKGRALFDLAGWMFLRRPDETILLDRAEGWGAMGALARAFALMYAIWRVPVPRDLRWRRRPAGLQGAMWTGLARRALWLPPRPGRIPTWYLQYGARVLGESPQLAAALRALLRPVLANPRLGGEGF